MFCCHNRSLAASAPIWTFREDAECDAFDRTVTGTFRKSSTACVDNIKALWKTLNTTASQGMLTYSVIMKLYIFIIPHFLQRYNQGYKELIIHVFKTSLFTSLTVCVNCIQMYIIDTVDPA